MSVTDNYAGPYVSRTTRTGRVADVSRRRYFFFVYIQIRIRIVIIVASITFFTRFDFPPAKRGAYVCVNGTAVATVSTRFLRGNMDMQTPS